MSRMILLSSHYLENRYRIRNSTSVSESLENFQVVNFEIDFEYSEEFLLGIFVIILTVGKVS